MEAMIDYHFVIDTYACAKYCVGYVLKCQGGVSKLFRPAIQEAKRGNLSATESLYINQKLIAYYM